MPLTIDDLGWTREQALAVRGMFASIAEDWDDPGMDVYDETPEAEARLNLPAAPPEPTQVERIP